MDKSSGTEFVTSISNVVAERGFNDFTEEGEEKSIESFCSRMESELSSTIQKIINAESIGWLSQKERVTLSLFAATQQLRVKSTRESFRQLRTNLRGWIVAQGRDPNEVEGFVDSNDAQIHADSVQLIFLAKDFAKYFYNKAWVLTKAPDRDPLYISDNPVTMHNYLQRKLEIYLPLSPHLSLPFFCGRTARRFKEGLNKARTLQKLGISLPAHVNRLGPFVESMEFGRPLAIAAENVEHQNSLQVIQSSRYILSHDGDFRLAREMLRDHPKLKEPRPMWSDGPS